MAAVNSLALLVMLVVVGLCHADVKSGKATTVTLNDGHEMPVFGLGTWLNGSSTDDTEVQKAVEVAIESGYRHIDTAAVYGTEPHVGRAIKIKIQEGIVKRDDLFITTKLWNTKHAEQDVVPALRSSLKELQLDYVDLYLIHWPIGLNADGTINNNLDYVDTWRGMEEAHKLGLTKSIGVSNFNISQLERVLKVAKIKPVCNQVEINVNLAQKHLVDFCKEKNIQIVAYTPLGQMVPSRSKGQDTPAPHIDDPVLTEIGKKYNKNTVQVVLRYLLDRGLAPIPKSLTPSRIRANIDVFDFKLTPEEIRKLDAFNLDKRTVEPAVWSRSIYYPF